MSYKGLLLGILLLLSVPAAASAQEIFAASITGTSYCGATVRFKQAVFVAFVGNFLIVATDVNFNNIIAEFVIFNFFATSATTGSFG